MATVNLRNKSGEPLLLAGRRVDVDEVVHIEGELAPKKDQTEDAIVIGTGDNARAYPTSLWSNAGGTSAKSADVPVPGTPE